MSLRTLFVAVILMAAIIVINCEVEGNKTKTIEGKDFPKKNSKAPRKSNISTKNVANITKPEKPVEKSSNIPKTVKEKYQQWKVNCIKKVVIKLLKKSLHDNLTENFQT